MASDMKQIIRDAISDSLSVIGEMNANDAFVETLARCAGICISCLRSGGKILLAGNGGSAADAQHIAGEFVSRFMFNRPGLAAMALTTDSSILTAIGNDYGYEEVFSRQIEALGKKDDVFIAYSTSGSSKNIVAALKRSRDQGLVNIGMSGARDGAMLEYCDVSIRVPSLLTPRIQEGHAIAGHILCGLIEEELFGGVK